MATRFSFGGRGWFNRARPALGIAMSMLAAMPVSAATISVTGVGGANGLQGISGAISTDGFAGGDGQSVVVEANAADPSNRATASGGVGGNGGHGGNGLATGASGSDGGDGGAGGDATAVAVTVPETGSAQAYATATGGRGGTGGSGGTGSNGGSNGNGGEGAAGGNALATATATAAGGAGVRVEAFVRGGAGGTGGFSPGSGTGIAGDGGAAGTAQLGPVWGTSVSGDVVVKATVIGGDGGTNGGVASAGANGAGVHLSNAIGGSTTGALTFEQHAQGGNGGSANHGISGSGGNASSSLTATKAGSGYFVGSVSAVGGDGGGSIYGSGFGGHGGAAAAALELVGDGPVNVAAEARGGNGGGSSPGSCSSSLITCGAGGDGGTAILGFGGVGVTGTSTSGGNVTVSGRVVGGSGGFGGNASLNGPVTGLGDGGDGASVSLVNSINGYTSGSLVLRQAAEAGYGGGAGQTQAGRGGTALSSLSRAGAFTRLELENNAIGGSGGHRLSTGGNAGTAGWAEAIANGHNTSGSLSIVNSATAGSGGQGQYGASGSDGAEAAATTHARVGGDGFFLSVNNRALGGTGGAGSGAGFFAPSGNGGDAVSSTVAIADGDSSVNIYDLAGGGHAGQIGLFAHGGSATSSARGSNTGNRQIVWVRSSASGGSTGGPGTPGSMPAQGARGGNAAANALAESSNGTAEAVATGGRGFGAGGGSAIARSAALTPNGTSTRSDARAATDMYAYTANGTLGYWSVSTWAQQSLGAGTGGGGSNVDEARAAIGDNLVVAADAAGLQAAAFVTILPTDADAEAALSGSEGRLDVRENFAVGGSSDMLGMVLLGAASSLDGSPTQSRTYSASAYLRFQSGDFPDEQRLLLGLLQPTVTGLGFESLRFQVNAGGGAAEIDQVFTDLAPAIAYFSGNTLDLGSIVSWNGLLDLQLDLTTRRAGDGFVIETLFGSSTIGANVPLPASGWLLVTAITFAATRSRSLRRNLRRA